MRNSDITRLDLEVSAKEKILEEVEHEAKEKEGEVEELERLSEKIDEAVLANQCGVQASVLRPPALGWT